MIYSSQIINYNKLTGLVRGRQYYLLHYRYSPHTSSHPAVGVRCVDHAVGINEGGQLHGAHLQCSTDHNRLQKREREREPQSTKDLMRYSCASCMCACTGVLFLKSRMTLPLDINSASYEMSWISPKAARNRRCVIERKRKRKTFLEIHSQKHWLDMTILCIHVSSAKATYRHYGVSVWGSCPGNRPASPRNYYANLESC